MLFNDHSAIIGCIGLIFQEKLLLRRPIGPIGIVVFLGDRGDGIDYSRDVGLL